MKTAAERARRFHELYEQLAPSFGYATRTETAVPWEDVPDNNKRLMMAVCDRVCKEQDRDTRHACAEATIKLARTVSQCSTVDFCKGFNDATVLAHDACLSVKAV